MIRLKISKHNDKTIKVEAVASVDHFGFGTFLNNLQPDEITIDEFSLKAILDSREKSGLQAMEIWADDRIAWGSPAEIAIIPINGISKMNGAEIWLNKIKPIKL